MTLANRPIMTASAYFLIIAATAMMIYGAVAAPATAVGVVLTISLYFVGMIMTLVSVFMFLYLLSKHPEKKVENG